MNLTDFEQTSLQQVYNAVRHEAERHGCAIAGNEIVGLVPLKALDTKADYFQALDKFLPAQILENRLAAVLGEREVVRVSA
jgi:glutamate formiminotransferase